MDWGWGLRITEATIAGSRNTLKVYMTTDALLKSEGRATFAPRGAIVLKLDFAENVCCEYPLQDGITNQSGAAPSCEIIIEGGGSLRFSITRNS